MRRPSLVQISSPFASRLTTVVAGLILSICPVATVAAQQQPQNAPSGHPIQQDVATPNNAPPDNASPGPTISVPPTLTIPAGTFVTVRLMGVLSSDQNLAGDGFSATLEQPIVVDGWVLARRGQIAVGTVVSAQKAGRVKGVSSLAVALSDLPVVDGRQVAVQSELVRTSAGTSKGRDAVGVATTTGVGAAIGGAVDGGAGAGIGAAAGAAAGIAGVLLTPGRPTVFPPETLLTFRLQAPITVDTQRGQVAFQPVGQQDYASADGPQLQRRQVVPAYPPAAYPYIYPYAAGPYWGSWGFYPAISFGYYGGYGWGRGYGWGHRGHWH